MTQPKHKTKKKAGIIATSSSVSSGSIIPVRPSWKDMLANYPGEAIKSEDFYAMVSDEWSKNYKKNPLSWANTCAGRMSYALNHSGLDLDKAPKAGSFQGKDGKNYWFRVADLKKYLKSRFKAGDVEYSLKTLSLNVTQDIFNKRVSEVKTNLLEKINGKHGIIVFEVAGWGDASGHFTLWDGNNLVYVGEGDHDNPVSPEYYFWLTRPISQDGKVVKVVQTSKIIYWELK